MSEQVIDTRESTITYEVWSVVTEQNGKPYRLLDSEEVCRRWQARHGGRLQVTRVSETTHTVVSGVDNTGGC